jgi:hypothetical protein
MNCPKCKQENAMGTLYCKHCGSNLLQSSIATFDQSSLFIGIYILITIGFTLIDAILPILSDSLGLELRSIHTLMSLGNILGNISFILLPLAIKDRLLKIIGIVVSIPFILYWVYTNFQHIIRIYEIYSNIY